jgi:hypothetical protein
MAFVIVFDSHLGVGDGDKYREKSLVATPAVTVATPLGVVILPGSVVRVLPLPPAPLIYREKSQIL